MPKYLGQFAQPLSCCQNLNDYKYLMFIFWHLIRPFKSNKKTGDSSFVLQASAMKYLFILSIACLVCVLANASDDLTGKSKAVLLHEKLHSNVCLDSLTALAPHHLQDLDIFSTEEAEKAMLKSDDIGTRTGGKTYPLFYFLRDTFVKPLRLAMQKTLEAEIAARALQPTNQPFYFSIVGLGKSASEFADVVDVLELVLKETGISLEALNFRIGLYDVMPDVLQAADLEYRDLVIEHPWLRDRVDVRFFDMSLPEFALTWEARRLGMVMIRNSLRNVMVAKGWPTVLAVHLNMVPHGFLVLDDEAKEAVAGPLSRYLAERDLPAHLVKRLPDFSERFYVDGTFGLSNSESESFIVRPYPRRKK